MNHLRLLKSSIRHQTRTTRWVRKGGGAFLAFIWGPAAIGVMVLVAAAFLWSKP